MNAKERFWTPKGSKPDKATQVTLGNPDCHGKRASKGCMHQGLEATEDRMTEYECKGTWNQDTEPKQTMQ